MSYGASVVWDDIAPSLTESGVLGENDFMALAAYCELFSEFKENPQEFPSSKMTQLRLLMADFGLTPSSRGSVGGQSKKQGNKFTGNGKPRA